MKPSAGLQNRTENEVQKPYLYWKYNLIMDIEVKEERVRSNSESFFKNVSVVVRIVRS